MSSRSVFYLHPFAVLVGVTLSALAAHAQTFTTEATAFNNNPEHTGSATFANFRAAPSRLWKRDLGGSVSYPLLAQNKIFVTVGDSFAGSMRLLALDSASGATAWSRTLQTQGYGSTAAYDNNRLFVSNANGANSTLDAYDPLSGNLLWSSPLSGQSLVTTAPVARNGIVYTAGGEQNGTLYAFDQATGASLWTKPVFYGSYSSPAVSNDGVYVSYGGPQTYKFDPQTGDQLWRFRSSISGFSGATPVVYRDNLYVRGVSQDIYNNNNLIILNSQTGAFETGLLDGFNVLPTTPVFDNGRGYISTFAGLTAFDAETGATLWSRIDNFWDYTTAPIIINGVVYVGRNDGTLLALDGVTGGLISQFQTGSSFIVPNERDNQYPLSGFAAANGLLVTPQGRFLSAYGLSVPEPSVLATGIAGFLTGGLCLRRRKV